MKSRREKANRLGVKKHSSAETILLVNWQPANTLITKLLYGQEKKLAAEQFVFLPKSIPCWTGLAFGAAAFSAVNIQHLKHPKSWESSQNTNEHDSGCIQANETSSFSHRLPSSISWIKPQPSNPYKNASFINKGLLCQLHHFLHTPGCRNQMRAPGLGSWQGSNSNGFVVQPEADLLNHLLATADPNPWKHFHLAPRDRNWDLTASRVHTLLLGSRQGVSFLALLSPY